MKINPLHHRTLHNPLAGIDFSREEKERADRLIVSLTQIPASTLRTLRASLARTALYLENEAQEWAEGESETRRVEQYTDTLVTYYAIDLALVGARVRSRGTT